MLLHELSAVDDRSSVSARQQLSKHSTSADVRRASDSASADYAEQRAIATALSDVDALLGGLDRLIAKKRDLKQAAMQQLLTGQTRLPGFHGEWEVKRLGEIARCFMTATDLASGRRLSRTARPCIRYGEIFTHDIDISTARSSRRSLSRSRSRTRQGDVAAMTTSLIGNAANDRQAAIGTASIDASICGVRYRRAFASDSECIRCSSVLLAADAGQQLAECDQRKATTCHI